MKDEWKSQKKGCWEIEELIVKKTIARLTPRESYLVNIHVQSCVRCQKYLLMVTHLEQALLNGENGEHLTPDPAIRVRIRSRMQAKTSVLQNNATAGKQFLLAVRDFKIPFYQAAAAFALILLMSYALSTSIFVGQQENLTLSKTAQMETAIIDSLNIIRHINFLEKQRVGRNIKQDSLIIRFIITSVDVLKHRSRKR